ncbi:MAG: hypothetical protein GC180_07530 [Bacteroidetes bacterium]|nr:hypothetical protein [Bacteroidota bacterium]
MKLFPEKTHLLRLNQQPEAALERLKRQTEYSERLVSQRTSKSFIGSIHGNQFSLISSAIGSGAFCALNGSVTENEVQVDVSINKPFRIILGIFLAFPLVALLTMFAGPGEGHAWMNLIVVAIQLLMIRFVFIELAFRYFSKHSLARLYNVMDIE